MQKVIFLYKLCYNKAVFYIIFNIKEKMQMSQNALLKYVLLSFVIMMFMTLPAHAKVLQVKGGYSNMSSQGVSIANGFMGSVEYRFNKNLGIAAQYEGYSQTAAINYAMYTGYLTLHTELVPAGGFGLDSSDESSEEPNEYSYLNDYLALYLQLGYSSWQASVTAGGTTITSSIGGFAYGLGFDIMPKSTVGGFIGYKGASYSNTFGSVSVGGLVAGIEVNF